MTDGDRYAYAYDPEGDHWAARLLRQVPSGATVLELGPGPGVMTRVLLERGHAVTVVEHDASALEALAALGCEVIAADLDGDAWRERLQGRRFDAVLACDVLEHLRDPECVLRALKECVAPQGRLVVSLPNVAYAGVVAALRLGVFDYADVGLLDRTHLRFFTRRSIEQVMHECGWVPELWDGYRLPVEHSEFAWNWRALDEAQRQALTAGWADHDVYEWMTVATPMADAAAREIRQAREEARQAREQLHALQLRHEAEHASLVEHQKAFGEAKEIIARLEREVAELRDRPANAGAGAAREAGRATFLQRSWSRLWRVVRGQ